MLLKLCAALETPAEKNVYGLELTEAESNRLAETLARLEQLHEWGPDVLAMSRNLQARLRARE